MDVKFILLGLLLYRSMTGYELKKVFSISFFFFSGLSYGSIYPALKKMESEGLISMQMEIQDKAPNRKVYTITGAGRKAFVEAMKAPLTLEKYRSAFLTRLFFFSSLEPEDRIGLARQNLESIKAVGRELEDARPKIERQADRFQLMCFQFGQRYIDDLARNVSTVIQFLEEDRVEPIDNQDKGGDYA